MNTKNNINTDILEVSAEEFIKELLTEDEKEIKKIGDLLNDYIDNKLNDFKNKKIIKTKIGVVQYYNDNTNTATISFPEDYQVDEDSSNKVSRFTNIQNQSVFQKLQQGDEVLVLKTLEGNYLIIGCTKSTALKRNSIDELYDKIEKMKNYINDLERRIWILESYHRQSDE